MGRGINIYTLGQKETLAIANFRSLCLGGFKDFLIYQLYWGTWSKLLFTWIESTNHRYCNDIWMVCSMFVYIVDELRFHISVLDESWGSRVGVVRIDHELVLWWVFGIASSVHGCLFQCISMFNHLSAFSCDHNHVFYQQKMAWTIISQCQEDMVRRVGASSLGDVDLTPQTRSSVEWTI